MELDDVMRLLMPHDSEQALKSMQKISTALELGKMDPDEFWEGLGYDPNCIKATALASANYINAEAGAALALIQMGAALAVYKDVVQPIKGPEV